MKRILKYGLLVVLVLAMGVYGFYVEPKLSLFSETKIVNNFSQMKKIFPYRSIKGSEQATDFEYQLSALPETYEFNGETRETKAFLDRSKTTGLLVIKDNKIIYEWYTKGYDKNSKITSFSLAKSFVATLVGILYESGQIESLSDPIDSYAVLLKGSGFEGVPIEHVLQMSTGVVFTETYNDKKTDVYKIFDTLFLWMQPLNKVILTYPSDKTSGEVFEYSSLNAHALGMLVQAVTGKNLSESMEELLWKPLEAEPGAYWLTDLYGTEMSWWGFSASLKDYAKLGLLYLNEGSYNGNRIVSEDWIKSATIPNKDFMMPGKIDGDWGYGYQFWVPRENEGDYAAIGIWGQMIYVSPKNNVVVVKTSADDRFKEHEYEAIRLFRTIR